MNTYYTREPYRFSRQPTVWQIFMSGLRRFMDEMKG